MRDPTAPSCCVRDQLLLVQRRVPAESALSLGTAATGAGKVSAGAQVDCMPAIRSDPPPPKEKYMS